MTEEEMRRFAEYKADGTTVINDHSVQFAAFMDLTERQLLQLAAGRDKGD